MKTTPNTFLKAALWYCSKGISVIPIKARSKEALVPWAEYQNRLPTREEIIKWWSDNPDANVAIVLGEVSNIIALEIDKPDAINGYQIPVTPQAISGGKNLPHIYFKRPNTDLKNYEKLEDGKEIFSIRTDGRYILAPPSIHPLGGDYKWSPNLGIHQVPLSDPPQWIIDLIKKDTKGEKEGIQLDKQTEYDDAFPVDEIVEIINPYYKKNGRQALALAICGFVAKQGGGS